MGNYVNKFFSHNNQKDSNEFEKEEIRNLSPMEEATVERDIMQTPPIIYKTLPVDPRSVTSGINRTPIEVNSTPVGLNKRTLSAIPRHLQSKPYLETDIDKVMLCLTPKKNLAPKLIESPKLQFPDMEDQNAEVLTPTMNTVNGKRISAIEKERYDILGLDPRSPAADFDRTPILMPKSLVCLKARSQENLHRQGSYDTDIFYPRFSYCETSSQFNVTEIQALPNFTCTAKSLDLGNLDSNCDDKPNEPDSSFSSHSSSTECTPEDGEEGLQDEEECEKTLEQENCEDVCDQKDTEQKEIGASNNNDIIKIWRDSLVLDEPQELKTNESENVQVQKRLSEVGKEEVIITFDDDSIATDTLSLKLAKSENDRPKVDPIGKKRKGVKSEIKVAADEKKTYNLSDKTANDSTKIRTPLGNRSNNGQMQIMLINSPQQVFRSKGVTPKMVQENTPPYKKYSAKSKLSGIQWDPDSTVII